MKTIDAKTRAKIARGWAGSSLTQDEYAAKYGISARTLRLYRSRYASRQPPVDQVRAIITGAMQELRDLLDSLDREEPKAACHSVTCTDQKLVEDAGVVGLNDDAVNALVASVRAEFAALPEAEEVGSARPRARPGSFFADMDALPR
ncbi:hypothetical protein A2cp1_0020 [Anaeromyxobacter dehalogenans 2CP-1]|uniref:Uncharacterized protein n=1 Tax=Anaeromyxobacter dehalogenans (strain ATCC BAA-258 / DSM 21875 / 2CP-1) TaxID=455488 RepID=B8J700_ANAD2|nr:hypothetical protein [Anaeromyxobacter dehalogenans]ACL63381.1 hypothetical protein A2cp1_0020 [Anaeromyxobacter dehalogenans 2CP-1]